MLGAAVRWVLTLLDNRAMLIKIKLPPVYQHPEAALYHQLADKGLQSERSSRLTVVLAKFCSLWRSGGVAAGSVGATALFCMMLLNLSFLLLSV